ncbi:MULTISPECIES: GNAT family N-acetyltransferase [unclassified Amycolatopsis]|uniref:GNAT family N-acetyltransferase n=1 Tax=unclassified Amycolatopsis TaxID=2618356 RepID=UPI00106EE4E3|nr:MULTISPECIES: GNAT family N-acetyltransferase [unclassified Amycolatopsis]
MPLLIERADFADPQLRRFLQAHLDDLAPTSPAESRHALDLAALQRPHVRLWTVRDDRHLVGTAALATLEPRHEELKSMRTDPARRGQGIARTLLDYLLQDAKDRGIERVSLETGSMDFFAPARALYTRAGFTPCAPFGSYRDDPNSTYLSRRL